MRVTKSVTMCGAGPAYFCPAILATPDGSRLCCSYAKPRRLRTPGLRASMGGPTDRLLVALGRASATFRGRGPAGVGEALAAFGPLAAGRPRAWRAGARC